MNLLKIRPSYYAYYASYYASIALKAAWILVLRVLRVTRAYTRKQKNCAPYKNKITLSRLQFSRSTRSMSNINSLTRNHTRNHHPLRVVREIKHLLVEK